MKKKTEDTINVDIDKKQIQVSWDCVKEVVGLHCRSYLQIFALFLAIGFSFLLAALTEKLPIIIGKIVFITFFYILYYRLGVFFTIHVSTQNQIILTIG